MPLSPSLSLDPTYLLAPLCQQPHHRMFPFGYPKLPAGYPPHTNLSLSREGLSIPLPPNAEHTILTAYGVKIFGELLVKNYSAGALSLRPWVQL